MNTTPAPITIPCIYIVDYWMPFPSSEYGGVQIVVAECDAHAERLLAESVDAYHREQYPGYRERIADRIKEAKRFPVDAAKCGVVYEFLT
jgi:hypothetical protein